MRYLDTKPNEKQLIESILKGPYQMKLVEDADKEAINILLLGLPDEAYKTVDDAKKYEKWFDGRWKTHKQQPSYFIKHTSTKCYTEKTDDYGNIRNTTNGVNKVGARNVENYGKGIETTMPHCYHCSGFRHIARNCTAPPRKKESNFFKQHLLSKKYKSGVLANLD
nr:hypothetical protein [Tanacetum cinerariifolium]